MVVGLRAKPERPAGAMLRRAGVSGATWDRLTKGHQRVRGEGAWAEARYNRSAMRNAMAITMQSLAVPGEKPPAQEQWHAMEKTMRESNRNSRKSARVL